MATDVLMKNPHTSCHPSSASQTTSSTKLSTSGVQPQNTSDARQTLDQTLDRILAKAKSPLGIVEARAVVEALEKMLEPRYSMSLRMRRRCFRGLVKTCGEYGILPSSYIIPESKIQKLGDSPISSGGFSDVWPGVYREDGKFESEEDDDGGRFIAIKIIRYCETDDIQTIKKNFCREVITWKRLSHPNILELIGVRMDEKQYCMMSPWMENGSIIEFLKENLQANPLKLLENAVSGLQYLHNVDLAHGDLKGGNILVSEEGQACLADVGLTRVASDLASATATSNTSTASGASTIRWCPPELLDPERFGSKRGSGPTKKGDMYSMAMTIYEVLTDRIPFYEYNDLVAMLHITQGDRPKKPILAITRGYTQELWDVTTYCWDTDPAKRPTVDHVLGTLKIAAERWKPKHGGFSTQDDWNSTVSEEESDSATESEDEPADDTSGPLDPPQPVVVETPVPAPASLAPPPSTVKAAIPLESTPATLKKEETKYPPAIPPKEGEESRPRTPISRKEPALAGPPREEGRQPIPASSTDRGARPAPVTPPKQEKESRPALAASKEEMRPVPNRLPKDEGPRPTPIILKKEDTNPTFIDSLEVLSKPYPPIPKKAVANSTAISPQTLELTSYSTSKTSLGDDRHTFVNASKAEIQPETFKERGTKEVSQMLPRCPLEEAGVHACDHQHIQRRGGIQTHSEV